MEDGTPGKERFVEPFNRSFDPSSEPPTARKLFTVASWEEALAPDAVRALLLCAELRAAWQREVKRVEVLERRLEHAEEKRQESERVAEQALKLANGVIAAVRSVQKEKEQTSSSFSSASGRRPSYADPREAAAAAAAAQHRPRPHATDDSHFTRRVVGGVSAIHCALCNYSCGTMSALDRHRATAHGLKLSPSRAQATHTSHGALTLAVPGCRSPVSHSWPASRPRSPPRAPSSGLGVAEIPPDLDQRFGLHGPDQNPSPVLHRGHSHSSVVRRAAQLRHGSQHAAAAATAEDGSSCAYAAPSVSWLRACGVANASRARSREQQSGL
jgi:hypothetical protein